VVYTEIKEARQRVRSRIGYARLSDAEIEANARVANELAKDHDRFLMDLPKYPSLAIEAWPELRVRLASLIKLEDFASINDYYRQLRVLVDLKEGRSLEADRGKPVHKFLRGLRDHAHETRQRLSKYASPPGHAWWLGF
jgi:hypothetical protein